MKRVSVGPTSDMFANYEVSPKHFVSNDQDFLFMNQITGTLAYWKKVSKRNASSGQTIRMTNIF